MTGSSFRRDLTTVSAIPVGRAAEKRQRFQQWSCWHESRDRLTTRPVPIVVGPDTVNDDLDVLEGVAVGIVEIERLGDIVILRIQLDPRSFQLGFCINQLIDGLMSTAT